MSKLIEQYYRFTSVADSKKLNRGQLCWGPGSYLSSSFATIELAEYNPKNESLSRYKILPNPPDNVVFNHSPVHELGLEYNEELLVVKSKYRPFVIISPPQSSWAPAGVKLKEHGCICLPLFSFHPQDLPAFRERVRALEYPWWIFLPEESKYKFKEGFLRLDRLQVIEKGLLKPTTSALTEDALFLISEWLKYHLTEEIDPIFLEDRQELLDELK